MKQFTSNFFDKLYSFGFIYSDSKFNDNEYPFYGKWESALNGKLLHSPKLKCFLIEQNDYKVVLLGHAYNPFTMEYDENKILSSMVESRENFLTVLNQLTGLFTIIVILGEEYYLFSDATSMQTCYYGVVKNNLYISSHSALIGELCNLKRSDYVNRLVKYKFFPLLGNYLPGDLSEFNEIKRLIPNHFVHISNLTIKTYRFYDPKITSGNRKEIANEVSKILSQSLTLIAKKWAKPALSLTGGCDSKTTLSCVEDYSKFSYFSYISSDEEKVDALAAKKIAETLQLNYKTYFISTNDNDFNDIEIHRDIIYKNTGCMRKTNLNDVRKRVYFSNINDFDVEVKSWASEIGRAYYSKRFDGKKNFGKITPRKLTTLYKFFLHKRNLVYETDKVFNEYIKNYMNSNFEIPWWELFFWEFRMSSWNGNVITGEQRYSYDITIPYNNRILLILLLSVNTEDRILDKVYGDIRQLRNPIIDKTVASVINVKHTTKRAKFEKLYYNIHSNIFF